MCGAMISYGDDRTLDTHIKLLRKSLGRYSRCIITLRGVGYRFETEWQTPESDADGRRPTRSRSAAPQHKQSSFPTWACAPADWWAVLLVFVALLLMLLWLFADRASWMSFYRLHQDRTSIKSYLRGSSRAEHQQ